jgi:hypothetical protein
LALIHFALLIVSEERIVYMPLLDGLLNSSCL